MRISALSLSGFRNLRPCRMEPASRLTVVLGENGQGKTNLIEAVYCLATGKSLRATRLGELVRWGESACRMAGVVCEQIDRRLEVEIRGSRRRVSVDSKGVSGLGAYSSVLKVVAFTPDDLQIVKGPAANRRRWMDRAVFTRRGQYAAEHKRFERALRARNSLLRQARETGRTPREIDAFDSALAGAGARLWMRRAAFVAEISGLVADRFRTIGKTERPLTIGYRSEALRAGGANPDEMTEEELVGFLESKLEKNRGVDLRRGFTTVGPQVDDVEVELDGRDTRLYASQGQQRAVVLAMKIAEIENLRLRLDRTPVLLLDDVSSELDPGRNAVLLEYLVGFPGQAWVTTTDPALAPKRMESDVRGLVVQDGKLEGDGVTNLE